MLAVELGAADEVVERAKADCHVGVLEEAVDGIAHEGAIQNLAGDVQDQEGQTLDQKLQSLFQRMKETGETLSQ